MCVHSGAQAEVATATHEKPSQVLAELQEGEPNGATAFEIFSDVFYQHHQASPHFLAGSDWMSYNLTQF